MPPTTVPADVTAAADVDSAARTDGLGVRCHAASTVEAHGRSATMRGKMRSGAMRGEVPVCAVGRDVRRPPIGQVMLDMGGPRKDCDGRCLPPDGRDGAAYPHMPPAVRAGGDLVVPPAVSNAMTVTQMAVAGGVARPAANDAGDGTRARHLLDSRGW
jgi:hypothetical protein